MNTTIKITTLFATAPRKIKYLYVQLTKHVQALYAKNLKWLTKKSEM